MTKIRATAATPSRVSTALEWLTTSCRAMAKSSTSVTARGVWSISILTNSMPTTMVMASAKKASALKLPPSTWERVPSPRRNSSSRVTARMRTATTSSRTQAALSRRLTKFECMGLSFFDPYQLYSQYSESRCARQPEKV